MPSVRRIAVFLGLVLVLSVSSVPALGWLGARAGSGAAGTATQPPGVDAAAGGQERTYYIAADTVIWDFAPTGRNQITGKPFDVAAKVFVKRGNDRIGSRYYLSLYRQYTDATFSHLMPRSAADGYLGILGPTIHAEVGDTIKVVFRNNTPYPASIHPHGVFYEKSSEGAPYNDGTSGPDKADDAVPHGGTHTYLWDVPERAGPGPMDPSSVLWMYHSHTDEVRDTNSGLLGAIVVTRRGMARPDGTPKDVDQEVFADFQIMDQNQSLYLARDIHHFARKPSTVDPDDEEFGESNLMHSINGFVFGNMPMITLHQGSHVRWYLMTLGTEVDLHTPHGHGNTVLMGGMTRTDMVQLLPGQMLVADMIPDDLGTWLFHCHVNDHILAGMLTRYAVVP